jgi:Rhs element Vgr protein
MSQQIVQQIYAALARFASDSRLYELTLEQEEGLGSGGLMVEAFLADDCLQEVGMREVIALSTSAHIGIKQLLGQRATLHASLADGSRTKFHGFVSQAAMLGSEGGLARYRLRLSPWLWLLTQSRASRVWQDASVADIVESTFQQYAPQARWRWSEGMSDIPQRSYCCQYRESDYDFVRRLLTEEGIAWRFDDTDDGQELVLFDDSTQQAALPEDASSESDGGLRYHAARAGEASDTIQSLCSRRELAIGSAAVLSYDYKGKRTVTASIPARAAGYGRNAPMLESCDYAGQYFYPNGGEAERYATLQMQAHEARANLWQARSTVRTLRAGTRFTLAQGPLDEGGGEYAVLRVCSVGVNNLPGQVKQGLAELFGPVPELLEQLAAPLEGMPQDFPAALAQARSSGYANCIEALPAAMPWRPVHTGGVARQHARPTAHGCQSAIVVGGDGAAGEGGAGEIHCDALGRVRIRFHWQDSADATCWVRVAQRSAGGGMGSQFLPRIGQEVLVQFLENDIDRPIIIGAMYNGQGEGGTVPTPGGATAQDEEGLFAPAHDHATSAQGNLAGGHSPVWHGAAAASGDHRNTASQWGLRSKEFGGAGYNQLLFDDADSQGRIQLRTTQSATELNLGHLLHGADNFRGSLRGQGAELRSDAYGAVRAGAGLLVSTYRLAHSAGKRDLAGDNVAGIAMLKQAVTVAQTFNDSAVKHGTVPLAAHVGVPAGKGSKLSDKEAPLRALQTAVAGMVSDSDVRDAQAAARERSTAAGEGKLPHSADPIVAMSAKEGLAISADRDLQFANGEVAAVISGKDTQLTTGAQLRLHSGEAFGMLGGAVAPGAQGLGLQTIAARDHIDVQAQAGVMLVQARDEINVKSSNAHIDWAAAKRISLSTAGGANITIDGGNITIQCPGKITIHAGKKEFTGAARQDYTMPVMPSSESSWVEMKASYDDAWNTAWPLSGVKLSLDGKSMTKAQSINQDL